MNANCERVIATLRREVLDHLLIWNETNARHILDAYVHCAARPENLAGVWSVRAVS
ncbi:hypothetical protein [Actinacidiphila oryziradicis]|uniref:hypothetical protein n=1 Tax=Actinacidiphila oryziradicis TaxID=2571141 RepID=UPI00268A0AD2|nr:hypothetical protein [Actinacidiphila oryziradicis]